MSDIQYLVTESINSFLILEHLYFYYGILTIKLFSCNSSLVLVIIAILRFPSQLTISSSLQNAFCSPYSPLHRQCILMHHVFGQTYSWFAHINHRSPTPRLWPGTRPLGRTWWMSARSTCMNGAHMHTSDALTEPSPPPPPVCQARKVGDHRCKPPFYHCSLINRFPK